MRTMYSKTFNLGNNIFQKEIFSYPIHYKNSNGDWSDIDLTISPFRRWEFTSSSLKNYLRTYFYDNTSDNKHLVSIEIINEHKEEKWVNLKLVNAMPTGVYYESRRYVFNECFSNIDVEYIIQEDNIKENIIIKQPTELRKFSFTLKMGGVKVAKDENNNIIFLDKNTNEIIYFLEKPFIIDSLGKKSESVQYELSNNGEFDVISIVINDEEFMREAMYPIIIDPSIFVQNDNSRIKTYFFDSGFNDVSRQNFRIQQRDNGICAIQFGELEDMKNLNFEINKKAIVTFNFVGSNTSYYAGLGVYVATNDWFNSLVTPIKGALIGEVDGLISSHYGNFYSFDITQYIDNNFYGLILYNKYNSGFADIASPYNSNTTIRPKLTVQYLVKPTLVFHDGTNTEGSYYADHQGEVFKYLDFGILTAGQTSMPQKVYLRNLSGFDIKNLRCYVDNQNMSEGVVAELSLTDNPFIPESSLMFNGTILDESDVSFYVRIKTIEDSTAGGTFDILANADPA